MRGPSDASATPEAVHRDRASRDRALFDRIAASYARKDLHEPSRVARIARLRRTLEDSGLGADADILEIGCGAGFAARYLRGRFRTYTGIDHSEELTAFASQLDAGPGVVFRTADLYDWQPTERYDSIFAIGVLHHLPDIPRAMAAMHALLRPGGVLVVNEPQPANRLFHGLRRLRAAIDASYSGEQEELEESRLVGYFEDAGFENVRCRGQGLLSTPFAEVALGPRALTRPLSTLACRVDTWLEDHVPRLLKAVSWNIVVCGRRAGPRGRSANDTLADVD